MRFHSLFVLLRLVNENEVKQWRDQAEKFRRGKCVATSLSVPKAPPPPLLSLCDYWS